MPRFFLLMMFCVLAKLQATQLASGQTVESSPGGEQADVAELPKPLERAHAHNDYAHERPLLDALEQGFCSVEADIFLVDGELLVGHTRLELRKSRTLESLYLKPLLERVKHNNADHKTSSVYQQAAPFTLLVDIKDDAEPTYQVLAKQLDSYRDMLTEYNEGKVVERAVQIVLSGNRPTELLAKMPRRLAFIDGRLSDLGSDTPVELMPLISDRWGSHFSWRGQGEFPAAEREKLHSIAKQAHASGQRLRFWATPETKQAWTELNAAGVDHINTDKLAELAQFLRID